MKTKFLLLFLLALSLQAFSESAENVTESEKSLVGLAENERFPMTDEESKTISTGKYFGGGAAASVLGFGIGHAIQGRYKERGWIFTAGGALRIIGWGGALYSFSSLSRSFFKLPEIKLSSKHYLFLGTIVVGYGIKIWEMIDVWMIPSNYKVLKESPFEIKPLAFYDPNTSLNYGLSLKYKF